MVGRKTTSPVDIEAAWKNAVENSSRRASMHLLENLAMVEDVEAKGEVELPITSLFKIDLLIKRREHKTFDHAAWQRYVARDEVGSVTLPMEWVTPLLEAFERYRFDEDEPSLDKAFGANRTDKHDNARKQIENLVHSSRLAAMIQAEQLAALGEGEDIGLGEAKARVLDKLEGEPIAVSESTLNRAWARWGDLMDKIIAIASRRR